MQTDRTTDRRPPSAAAIAVRAAVAAGCALFVCGCNTDQQVAGAPEVPADYRLRHPITLQESDRTLELFIGSNRGELNPTQRAQVLVIRSALEARSDRRHCRRAADRQQQRAWRRPTPCARSSRSSPRAACRRKASSCAPIRRAGRISPRSASAIRRSAAQAGPCGLWPEDIGPSMNRDYFENQPPWNFGCATSAISPPWSTIPPIWCSRAPRPPAYATRRTTVIEKYRQGQDPSTPRIRPTVRQPKSATSASNVTSSATGNVGE